jgi:hypothetical protein
MKLEPRKLAPLGGAAIAFVAGYLLKGPAADPDAPMARAQVLGSFLVFLGWAVCAFGWGRALSRATGVDRLGLGRLAPGLVLGTVALSAMGAALGFLGLAGYALLPLHLVLLLLGPLLGLRGPRERGSKSRVEVLVLALVLLDLGHRFVRAGLANGSTDPAMYHLFAPRYWNEAGRITFSPNWPEMFHASHWEHLFIWGGSLLGGPMGRGLIETQFFGQWVHVLGFAGALAALYALLVRFGVPRAWAAAALLVPSCSQGLLHYTSFAKNGLGLASWSLFSLLLLMPGSARTPLQLALGGALAGMAISGKATLAASVLPWLAVAWWLRAREKGFSRSLADARWVVLGAVLGALPIYARNLAFTGNPFFPILGHGLWPAPEWWSQSSHENLVANLARPAASLAEVWRGLKPLLLSFPLTPIVLLLPPFAMVVPAWRPPAAVLTASLVSFAAFSAFVFANAFPRWLAPSLLLVDALAVGFAGLAASRFLKRKLVELPAAFVAAALVFGGLVPFSETIAILRNGMSADVTWRTPPINEGGDSKAWLRRNARPGLDPVVSLGERGYYPYYFLRPVTLYIQPDLDSATYGIFDGRELVRRLRSFGLRYAIDVRHFAGGYYSVHAKVMAALVRAHPEAVVYRGKDSYVVDLAALERRIERGCVLPSPLEFAP